jgi:glutamate transport system substrate-binding protein
MRLRASLRLSAPATALAVALVLAAATACSTGASASVADRASSSGTITIGVRVDQPGLSLRTVDGKYQGFDVDVAKYIAKEFGVGESGITWKEVRPTDREKVIQNGDVDMVVASYTITDKRKQQVDFAGPYFSVGQDLLIRSTSNDITGPDSLNNGKTLCSVAGTTNAQQIKDKYAQRTTLLEYPKYYDCVIALISGKVDAVTSDDVILAGYAAQNPELLRVVGKPFTSDEYGIGLKKGDTTTRQKINTTIEKMVSDGSWRRSLDKYVAPSGYKIPDAPRVSTN